MAESFQFNDPSLNEVVGKNAVQFRKFKIALDQASADIRNLEKWLQGNGIPLYASIVVGESQSIAWSRLLGDWRLVYEFLPADEEPFTAQDPDTGVAVRPLIEVPVITRLHCHRYLPMLIEAIGQKLLPEPPQKPKTPRSISVFAKLKEQRRELVENTDLDLLADIP